MQMWLERPALGRLIIPLLIAMTESEIGNRKKTNQPRVIKHRSKFHPLTTKPRNKYVTH